MAAPSAPTLPFTRPDLEDLPDFSTAEDDEGETHIMPTQGMPLSTVGERPAVEPHVVEAVVEALGSTRFVDAAEQVAFEHVAVPLAKDPDVVHGPAVVAKTLCSFEPKAPIKKPVTKRHPPLKVWATVILLGAVFGITGGAVAAKATSSAPIEPVVTPFAVVPVGVSGVPSVDTAKVEPVLATSEIGTVESPKAKATRGAFSPHRPPSKKSGKNPAHGGANGLLDSAIQ